MGLDLLNLLDLANREFFDKNAPATKLQR